MCRYMRCKNKQGLHFAVSQKKKDKRGMNSQYMFLQLSKTGFLKNFGEILIRISLSFSFCQRKSDPKHNPHHVKCTRTKMSILRFD